MEDEFLQEAAPDSSAFEATYAGNDPFNGGDEFASQVIPDGGYVFTSEETPAVESSPAATTNGVNSFAVTDDNALLEFNKKFREINDKKDSTERDAKAARRTAGKTALKAMVSERQKIVESRKSKNREDEKARESAYQKTLKGESWSRVADLIDVHAASATEKKKHHADEAAPGDVTRMKDVLIAVKNTPPPTA